MKYGRSADEFGMFFLLLLLCFAFHPSFFGELSHNALLASNRVYSQSSFIGIALARSRHHLVPTNMFKTQPKNTTVFCSAAASSSLFFFVFSSLLLLAIGASNIFLVFIAVVVVIYSFVWTSCAVLNRVLICNVYSSVVNERRSLLLKQRSKLTNLFSESLFGFRRSIHSSPVCAFASELIEIIDTDSGMQFKTQTVTVNFVLSRGHRVREKCLMRQKACRINW